MNKMLWLLINFNQSIQQNLNNPKFQSQLYPPTIDENTGNSTINFEHSKNMGQLATMALAFAKSIAMRDMNDVFIDKRINSIYKILSANPQQITTFLQPYFLPLHTLLQSITTPTITPQTYQDLSFGIIPPPILPTPQPGHPSQRQDHASGAPITLHSHSLPLTQENLKTDGFYLISNAFTTYLYIGAQFEQTHANILGQLFGVDTNDETKLILIPPPNPATNPPNPNNTLLYKMYSMLNTVAGVYQSDPVFGSYQGSRGPNVDKVDPFHLEMSSPTLIILRETVMNQQRQQQQQQQQPGALPGMGATIAGGLPAELLSCFVLDPQVNVASYQQYRQLVLEPR